MDGIKRSAKKRTSVRPSSVNHRTLQKSSTLNRKFVKKPQAKPRIKTSAQKNNEELLRRQALAKRINQEKLSKIQQANQKLKAKKSKSSIQKKERESLSPATHPAVKAANARLASTRKVTQKKQLSAQELKDRAIKQALQRVASMNEDDTSSAGSITKAVSGKKKFSRKKLFLAFATSIASILLLGYLVHLNIPNLSVRVTAMQSGIEGSYPSYIPTNYRLDGLVSEKNGKIVMNFVNKENKSFTLTEQKSPWNSAALLSQFVTPEWGENYTTTKNQGLTIYISGANAVWVNGGVFYNIASTENHLTTQQLHDIAISL